MSQRSFKDVERGLEFREGGFVKTIKGAQFWGKIIAIESEHECENPGCTVMAIAPGFQGVKHVYPIKQLTVMAQADLRTLFALAGDSSPETFVAIGVGDGRGREFVHGPYSAIKRVQRFVEIVEAASKFVGALQEHPHSSAERSALIRLVNRIENDR